MLSGISTTRLQSVAAPTTAVVVALATIPAGVAAQSATTHRTVSVTDAQMLSGSGDASPYAGQQVGGGPATPSDPQSLLVAYNSGTAV